MSSQTPTETSSSEASHEAIGLWVYGYGSLIWRPAMQFDVAYRATAQHWARRFWQGSHDHRGTVDAPGRVLTLVSMSDANCVGRVFGIPEQHVEQTLKDLDYREKNGYERQWLTVYVEALDDYINALTYVAPENNVAWLGDAPMDEIVAHIKHAAGPSGTNEDYAIELFKALQNDDIYDEHIAQVAHGLQNV